MRRFSPSHAPAGTIASVMLMELGYRFCRAFGWSLSKPLVGVRKGEWAIVALCAGAAENQWKFRHLWMGLNGEDIGFANTLGPLIRQDYFQIGSVCHKVSLGQNYISWEPEGAPDCK